MSDHLILGSHVKPDVVKLTRNGEYIATWRVEGIAFNATEDLLLNQRLGEINNTLAVLSGGQISIWSHQIRRKTADRLPAQFTQSYCRELDSRYATTFDGYSMLLTEIYITLIYRPIGKKTNIFNSAKRRTRDQILEEEVESLASLDNAAKQLEASLNKFGLHRLSVYKKNGVEFSGMASLYGFLINGFWDDVPYQASRLSSYLPTATIYFGERNGLAQTVWNGREQFHAFIEMKEYPIETKAGLLNTLLSTPYEWVMTHSFSMMAKGEATKWLNTQMGRMTAGDEASVSEVEAINTAIDEVRSGKIDMGEHHFTLNVLGGTVEEVSRNAADAMGLIGAAGGRTVLSRQVPELSWLAQLPGAHDKRPRKAVISSLNFAGFNPLHNFASGRRSGNPWGHAVSLLQTESGQPYYFNFHAVAPGDGDKTDEKLAGNTFVAGTTGVGKTTTLAFLLAQSQRFNPKIIFFDRGRNAEILIRMMGGQYTNLRVGKKTGLNPFQWDDTPTNRKLCMDVISRCVFSDGQPLTASQKDEIAKAVDTVFGLKYQNRRISAIPQNLQDGDLTLRLQRWHGNGDLAWVLDNAENTLNLNSARIMGFDYTEFLEDPEIRTVVMMVLLSATDQAMDGTPTILVMDEFWKPLMDPVFAKFAHEMLKTIRHRSGLGIFVTQSPSDVLDHPIAKTVVEQCVTQIFLPNIRATASDYIDGFKLNSKEYELLANFGETSRKMLIKQGDRSNVVKLDLSAVPDDIIVLSGSKDNVAMMDKLIAVHGEDPDVWWPLLKAEVHARKAAKKVAVITE